MSLDLLLLGGSGLMGEPLVRTLTAAGHRVTVLSRGERALPPGATLLRADRRDAESLKAALAGRRFDGTVDLLAYDAGDVERLWLDPYAALGRYVMISSGQVYLVTESPQPPFSEETASAPLMPEPEPGTRDHAEWAYGVGKRRAEAALVRLRRSHGVRGTALRIPVVQGAGDVVSRRLWSYLQRLQDGGGILLPDGGENLLRFIWAEDVARACRMLLEGADAPEPAYNLAQPEDVSLRELVTAAAAELGVPARLVSTSAERIAAAGIDPVFSPYSGRWCSRPDPARAAEWGFVGTSWREWLPQVVRAQVGGPEPWPPHKGYTQRPRELALIAELSRGA